MIETAGFYMENMCMECVSIEPGNQLDWLSSVFTPICAAFIVAGFSYLAIRMQLKHDSEEKRKQREIEMRKQVYFDACEAIAMLQSTLAFFPQSDLKNADVSACITATAALSKLHFIAGIDLIKKLIECQHYFSTSMFKLTPVKINCERLAEERSQYLESHKQCLNRYTYLTEKIKSGSLEIEEINKEQDELEKKMELLLENHSLKSDEHDSLHLDLVKMSLECTIEYSKSLAGCNILIRQDLGSKFSSKEEVEYLRIISQSSEGLAQKMDNYLQDIKEMVDDIKKG